MDRCEVGLMLAVTISQIEEKLQLLSPERLTVVLDFVSYLAERETNASLGWQQTGFEAFQTMLASEAVLRRDWERPEEDAAWADL